MNSLTSIITALIFSALSQFDYKLPYPKFFGSVTALSVKHFQLLNGWSNQFWGWGGKIIICMYIYLA